MLFTGLLLLFCCFTSLTLARFLSRPEYFPEDASRDGLSAAADFIMSSMDMEADPCEDFNQFKCGKIRDVAKSKYPGVDNFDYWDVVKTNFTRKIVKLLDELKPDDTSIPDVFRNVKLLYDKCLDRADPEALNTSISDAMKAVAELGGAPMLDADWLIPSRSIISLGLDAQRRLGGKMGLRIVAEEDLETNRNSVYLKFSTNGLSSRMVSRVMKTFARLAGVPTVSAAEVAAQETEMDNLDQEFEKIVGKTDFGSYSKDLKILSLKDLSEIDVETAEALAEHGFKNSTTLQVPEFLIERLKLLKPLWGKYSRYKSALQNFLIGEYLYIAAATLKIDLDYYEETGISTTTWQTSTELPETTTITPQKRKHDYGSMIQELPEDNDHCLKLLVTDDGFFQNAALRLVVEKYGPNQDEAMRIRNLIDLVTEQIRRKFFNATWLDFPSKIRAMNKLTSIIPRIAYPLWLINDTAFIANHQHIEKINSNDSYLTAFSKVHSNQWTNAIKLAFRPVSQDINNFGGNSFITNAWYQRDRNAFLLTLGLLQPPFYRPDYPPAMIYGIIAAVIGHEMTHAFDADGIHYTLDGRDELWMTEESIKNFKKKTECLIEQYGSFCYNLTEYSDSEEVEDELLCLDGERTASENIADLNGLKAAFQAYKIFEWENKETIPPRVNIPGLESYSWDQIFFLSFGSVWCSAFSSDDLSYGISYDVHSPGPSRINGTLQNMHGFSDAFSCPEGSKMNPVKKCSVW